MVAGAMLSRGDAIDRFLILDQLGAGAMGVVYRAYDPELDRRVALKLLAGPTHEDPVARDRLIREAQALARLQDGNVVTIFDVGTQDDQVFLAMELIEGETLGQRLRHDAPAWRAIVKWFVAAGSGLAAAHRAGLCHRDFKPANVLVSNAGLVKVVDFGLARPGGAPVTGPVARGRLEVAQGEDPLSRSGTAAGTPLYMAPEVHDGEPADAASDQYSFCVALFEALAGKHPFAGLHDEALVAVKRRPLELGLGVPTHLRRAVARGMALDPAARFETMEDLLGRIRRDPTVWRRRLALVAAAAIVGAAVQYGVLAATDPGACAQAEARWDAFWGPEDRAAVRAALLAPAVPYSADAAEGVEAGLDAYAAAWIQLHDEACGKQGELYAAHMLCLDHRLIGAQALVDRLREANATTVERAVQAVSKLEALDTCGRDAAVLARMEPAPREVAAAVEAVRALLESVKAMERTGEYDEGLALARETLTRALELEYAPLEAEARYQLGRLEEQAGAFEDSAKDLQAAHWLAEGTRHERLAADSAAHVVFVLGSRLRRFDEALAWGEHAKASVQRVGGDELAQSELLNALGTVRAGKAEYADALELYRQALVLKERAFGEDSMGAALMHMNVAVALEELGQFDAALAEHRSALELLKRNLGPEHPSIGAALVNLAGTEDKSGALTDALAHYRESLRIKRAALGDDHPSIVYALDGVGRLLRRMGRLEESMARHQQAVELARRVWGPNHASMGTVLHNLGITARERGDLDEARDAFEHVLKIWRAALGDEHPHVATAMTNLSGTLAELGETDRAIEIAKRARDMFAKAVPNHPQIGVLTINVGRIHHDRGEHQQARALYEEADRLLATQLPPEHPDRIVVLEYLGELDIDVGRPAAALPLLEKALRHREAADYAPLDLAKSQFITARALWASASDRARARHLADAALALVREHHPGGKLQGVIEAWVETHS